MILLTTEDTSTGLNFDLIISIFDVKPLSTNNMCKIQGFSLKNKFNYMGKSTKITH